MKKTGFLLKMELVYNIFYIVLSNKYGNEDVYSASDVFIGLRGYGWVISTEQHDAYEFFQSLISTAEEEARGMSSVEEHESSFTTKYIAELFKLFLV